MHVNICNVSAYCVGTVEHSYNKLLYNKFLDIASNDLSHVLQYLMGNCPDLFPAYNKQFDPEFLVCYMSVPLYL